MIRSQLRAPLLAGLAGLAASLLLACASSLDEDLSAAAARAAASAANLTPAPSAGAEPVPTAEAAMSPGANAGPAAASVSASLEQAVLRAGERLLADARAQLGEAPRELVIDPVIDANTGQQTASSSAVGAQLASLIAAQAPIWKVLPLSRKALANAPLLLMGTLTATQPGEATSTPPETFRLWLTLADLRTGRIAAKRLVRVTTASVNAEPTRFFRDTATLTKDHTVSAYTKSCQIEARVGDPLDSHYLMRLPAQALLNEAITAYNEQKFETAHRLFVDASRVSDAYDLRVLNGRYLSSWRLGKKAEAAESMTRIVALGLAEKQLQFKILFEPGGTTMLPGTELRAQYRLWLREAARQADGKKLCVRVTGHASRNGTLAASEALSLRRAAVVRWILARDAPASASRFSAEGVGWRDNLIGLGSDDVRDTPDRRTELRVISCP